MCRMVTAEFGDTNDREGTAASPSADVRARPHLLIASFAVLTSLAAGYAVATSSLLVGVAVTLGAASVAFLTWPSLVLAALALPYVLPVTASLGGLRSRDLAAACFGIVLLTGIQASVLSRRMMVVLALDAGFAAIVLVSAIGFFDRPAEAAILAETGAGILLLASGVALGAMIGLEPILRAIRLVVLGIAVVALISWVFQNGSPFESNAFSEQTRAGAVLGPNGLGTFLAIGAVMEITLRRASLLTVRSLAVVGLLIGVVLLSGSRGAVLVLGLGLLPLAFGAKPRLRSVALAALLVTGMGWAIVTLASVRVVSVERVGGDPASVENSPEIRIEAAKLAVRLMLEHPLTGVGYGQVAGFATSDPRLGFELDTHNEYLRIGAESGITALILLLCLIGLCLKTGVESVRRDRAGHTFAATAAVAAFALSLLTVQGFLSFVFSAPWMLLSGAIVGATEAYRGRGLERSRDTAIERSSHDGSIRAG